MLNFRKMHGAGNDFAILDFRTESRPLSAEQITRLCDRHFGIGCDQLVVMEFSETANFRAIFYNADGSQSGACGNATRCLADIYMTERGDDTCTIETLGGILKAFAAGPGQVCVDMGPPRLEWDQIPLAEKRDTLLLELGQGAVNPAVAVNMGNPHCVIFVDDVAGTPITRIGPAVENSLLFPERTNVEFVQVMEGGTLRQRTWERGSGETLACGSGACAVAVAAIRRGLIDGRHATVQLDGGTLEIEWREADGHVLMTGPVAYIFDGTIKDL
jgi:diaminopimelate epimerase